MSVHDSSHVGNGINIAMGVWLVISAFLWPHDGDQRLNAVVIGSMIAVTASLAMMWRPASWVAALPAVWLFGTSLFAEHHHALTPWHNVAIAFVVFMSATAPLAASPTYGGRTA
jgi:hypothetical protein